MNAVDPLVTRLNDHFGQYLPILTCTCGHCRECYTKTLANFAGWDAELARVVRRMRTNCRKHGSCAARSVLEQKPSGYISH